MSVHGLGVFVLVMVIAEAWHVKGAYGRSHCEVRGCCVAGVAIFVSKNVDVVVLLGKARRKSSQHGAYTASVQPSMVST